MKKVITAVLCGLAAIPLFVALWVLIEANVAVNHVAFADAMAKKSWHDGSRPEANGSTTVPDEVVTRYQSFSRRMNDVLTYIFIISLFQAAIGIGGIVLYRRVCAQIIKK